MRYKITAPVEGVNSTVAGICFRDSVAETDAEGAIAYFRRHGYQVEEIDAEPERKAAARQRKQAPPKPAVPDGQLAEDGKQPAASGEDKKEGAAQ